MKDEKEKPKGGQVANRPKKGDRYGKRKLVNGKGTWRQRRRRDEKAKSFGRRTARSLREGTSGGQKKTAPQPIRQGASAQKRTNPGGGTY